MEVTAVWRYLSCCLDKRVLIVLGVVAAVMFVVVPQSAVAALPVLVGLVCPASMLVMGVRMNRNSARTVMPPDGAIVEADRLHCEIELLELAALRREIDELQVTLGHAGAPLAGSVPDPVRGGDHRSPPGGRP